MLLLDLLVLWTVSLLCYGVAADDTTSQKLDQLNAARENTNGKVDTTDNGVKANTSKSLRAGPRGYNLLEDTSVRKKMIHFDRERIPERVVHALGHGAYGQFESYGDWSNLTMACWLQNGSVTEAFTRFSVVVSSTGGSENQRDTHGFATKLYSPCGNQDFVGNHLSSFFINDGAQFPDLIHAVKMEANKGFPTDGTAHPTAYDFFNLHPESTFQLMNVLSNLGIPRDTRHMAGYGVHTFRMINAEGKSTLFKWYWLPTLGFRSLVYDEATTLAGKNNNFQRIDLYNNIEDGNYPSWEFAVQMFPDDGSYMWNGYDLLIPTQIVPFEVNEPVKLGKLTLNRNFRNFFAEPESVAFSPANVVDGISWVPDPLLQWRLMSYDDTSSHRHGSPNAYQLPVNRPIAPINNNYRDGYMQNYIFEGDQTSTPNGIGGVQEPGPNATFKYTTGGEGAGMGPIGRYTSTFDWFAQARLFWGTQDIYAQQATVDAYRFELGNVGDAAIVQKYIDESLNSIDNCLARRVAFGIGATLPAVGSGPQTNLTNSTTSFPSLYPLNPGQQTNLSLAGLSVAIVANDSLLSTQTAQTVMQALMARNVSLTIVAPRIGILDTGVYATSSYTLTSSTFYDAVLIGDMSGPTPYDSSPRNSSTATGSSSTAQNEANAMQMMQFVMQAYNHQKPIGALSMDGMAVLEAMRIAGEPGVYCGSADAVTMDVMQALMGPARFPQRFPTDDVVAICS